jgi:hypothetical protein
MADYETIPKEDAQLQPSKPKSLKFAATVAAICARAASAPTPSTRLTVDLQASPARSPARRRPRP